MYNMIQKDHLLSDTISFLRFPLTVGVVFIHFNIAEGIIIKGVTQGGGYPCWYYLLVTFFSDVLPRICVPLFFVISGFLYFYKVDFDRYVYLKKIKTRIRTLLIPYIIWNIIAVIWYISRSYIIGESFDLNFSINHIINTFINDGNNNGIIIKNPVDMAYIPTPICGVLWYVRDLMLMVVISPLLHYLIKKVRVLFIVVLGVIWISDKIIIPQEYNLLVSALFFFSWGGVL